MYVCIDIHKHIQTYIHACIYQPINSINEDSCMYCILHFYRKNCI